MGHTRPIITDAHIAQISNLLIQNPDWNRSRLSFELCELWDWKSAVGQPKDISARDLLRDLDRTGLIKLPPPQRKSRIAGAGTDKVLLLEHDTNPIEGDLSDFVPLKIGIATCKDDVANFKSYIAQFHYLGWNRSVGENLKYMIRSADGIPLACMMFGSAAWKCKPRDEFIGWGNDERRSGLHLLTNNVRNLIFPWVSIPHLASHALAAVTRRLSGDWQTKYGHPIVLLETFVEQHRFRGILYKAANWVNVGMTTGRGRDSKSICPTLPVKDIWVYPLRGDFRKKLIKNK